MPFTLPGVTLQRVLVCVVFSLGVAACTLWIEEGGSSTAVSRTDKIDENSVLRESVVDEQRWYALFLGEQKIGYRFIEEARLDPARRMRRERLHIVHQQPGELARVSESEIYAIESTEGEPLEIRKVQRSDTANHEFLATVEGNNLVVRGQRGEAMFKPLPPRWRLHQGRRSVWRAAAERDGAVVLDEWSFSLQRFRVVEYRLTPIAAGEWPESLVSRLPDLPVEAKWLQRIEWQVERVEDDGGRSQLYLDARFDILAEHSETAGQSLWLLACDEHCATSNIEAVNHVYQRLLRSPYRISDSALNSRIRYELEWPDSSAPPPETAEQHVVPAKGGRGGYLVTVCDRCGEEPMPAAEVLQQALADNYWLTLPDAARVTARELVSGLADGDISRRGAMNRLTRYVTAHMNEVASYAGYATADEAYRSGEGDCTEHALLLAALARSVGIPTRIAMGVAYNNERFLGRRFVFVPHMWVQAWTGEAWESYDSALGSFNAGYITLGISQGEQDAYLAINNALVRANVLSAVQLRRRPSP